MRCARTKSPTDAVESARPAFEAFPEHWHIASRAIQLLAADERVVALYLSGSFATGKPDRWSDIDLYVVVPDGAVDKVIASHERLFREVGEIATLFPATHLGDPHQWIAFYRAREPIHVDYQYRPRVELQGRRPDSSVITLLDRAGELGRWREACREQPVVVTPKAERLQYLEDRFWGWCWYTHGKVERRELWEARDAVEYLRSHVLVPLAHREDQVFEGNRRLEDKLPPDIQDLLATTVPASHTANDYARALDRIMHAYTQLFASLPQPITAAVRRVDRDYFIEAIHDEQPGQRP